MSETNHATWIEDLEGRTLWSAAGWQTVDRVAGDHEPITRPPHGSVTRSTAMPPIPPTSDEEDADDGAFGSALAALERKLAQWSALRPTHA